MYTEDVLLNVGKRAKRETILSLALLAAGFAAALWALIQRQKLAGALALALLVMAAYGVYALRAAPWRRYRRFLLDVAAGRSHENTLWFTAAQCEAHMTEDGVLVRDVVFGQDPSKKDPKALADQVYYWDAGYPFPAVEPGRKVTVKSFGRYILSIREAG